MAVAGAGKSFLEPRCLQGKQDRYCFSVEQFNNRRLLKISDTTKGGKTLVYIGGYDQVWLHLDVSTVASV
jgi:hypothetical protein